MVLFTTIGDFNADDCAVTDDEIVVVGVVIAVVVAVAFDIVVGVVVIVTGAGPPAIVGMVLRAISSRRLRPAVRFLRSVSLQISSYIVLEIV